jgi:LmbE family N-acetylglucosaminyl deacetylase
MKKKLNILALSPHADDVEIAMGGTIAKYVDEGHNVTIVTAIIPKENKDGKIDKFMSKNRIKEQKNSAKILGASVDILDLDPYEFSFNRKYVKIFDKKINEYKPDIIFSCWEHDSHQDHKNLSDILFAVSRKNNISINMYEVMLPGGLNTYSFNPQYFVNISKYIDVKIASIKSYKSVFEKNPNNYSQYFESIAGRAKFRGGVIGVDYAEAFVIAKKIEI